MSVALGLEFSLTVDSSGSVWAFGHLGNYLFDMPTRLDCLEDIVEISCGAYHFLAVDSCGDVFSYSTDCSARIGKLGRSRAPEENMNTCKDTFRVPHLKNIVSTACGLHFSICVDSIGLVWGFGENGAAQLGIKEKIGSRVLEAIQLEGLENIQMVSCGFDFAIFLDSSGSIYGMGNNENNQLGLPEERLYSEPTRIPIHVPLSSISSGYSHTLAIDINGDIWCFGDGSEGQIGKSGTSKEPRIFCLPSAFSLPVTRICTSENASHIIDSSGQYWTCGYNDPESGEYPLLGIRDANGNFRVDPEIFTLEKNEIKNIVYMPRQCLSSHMLAMDSEGSIWTWGENNYPFDCEHLGRPSSGEVLGTLAEEFSNIIHDPGPKWKKIKSARTRSIG